MVELNDQGFYYSDFRGRLLGNKAREQLVLEEVSKLGRSDFFLEVGCAQGYFEGIARRFSQNVFGGEVEYRQLHNARKRFLGCDFVGVNAERLPFKNKVFDFVLCTEVLEHVPNWKLALKELQRVSRKRILVTVPLEKGYVWRTISKFKAMDTRGHLHALDSKDIEGGLGKGWNVAKQEVIATPSRRVNKVIGKRASEKIGMYSMVLLEKKEKS